MKRAGLYIRVSTDEQARHGFSLGEQRHTLEEYAARNGFTVVDTYADEGASARKEYKRIPCGKHKISVRQYLFIILKPYKYLGKDI